jgi:Concanavalin A-like lectin/glucanases superfamily
MNPDQQTQLREEALRWILSILAAIVVYLVVAAITLNVYHPDIEQLRKMADELLLPDVGNIEPEPMEAMLFRLGIITIIPSLLGFYTLLCRINFVKTLAAKKTFMVLSALCVAAVAAIIVIDFTATNTSDNTSRFVSLATGEVPNTNFNFFFDGFFLGKYLPVYALIVVPAVWCLFFIALKKKQWEGKKLLAGKLALISGYLVLGGVLLTVVLMNTFDTPYSVENKYDFAAVYYSMTQVFAGVPMLVDGFTNTYGLYPHFLNPLFQLTGLSVFKFSLTMSLILLLCFVLNFYVLRKFVSNKIILFLGFATMLFFSYLDRKLLNHFDNYFALFPIRYVIPSVLLFLTLWYVSRPSQKLYFATFFVMASFILWNPEIGIVCYLSWIAVNIYRDLYDHTGKINLKKIAKNIITGTGAAVIVFYSYKLIIWAYYGVWPDLGLLWNTIFVFGKVGFGLLPMDVVHPWNVAALILIVGFMYAIAQLHKKAVTPKATIILLLSLIGVGYFFYYQGRSHSSHLSSSMGFCLLLLTILGDELWAIVKRSNDLLFSAFFTVFLFLVSFSFIELLYNSDKIIAMVYQEDDKNHYAAETDNIDAGRRLIEKTSKEHEKILVLAQRKNQPLFLDGSKRIHAFNPGYLDLFFKSDVPRMEDMIVDSNYNIYLESSNIFFYFMYRPWAAMAAKYTFNTYDHSMVLLTPRKHNLPTKSFFEHRDGPVLHRKYTDDREGYKSRINDAMGIQPISLSSEFSVEVLFFNSPQMYPEATLAGNAQDSSGFVIGKVFNESKYFFALSGAGYVMPVPDGQWVYLVMNVYPDHVAVFCDGTLLHSQQLIKPWSNSDQKVYIGNLGENGKGRFFVGAIAEVNIANKTIDSNQISATWTEMISTMSK